MSKKLAYTTTKPVTFSAAVALPIDAYKAIINFVEDVELKVAEGATIGAITDKLLTGTQKGKVYKVTFSAFNTVAGTYTVSAIEVADNVDGLS